MADDVSVSEAAERLGTSVVTVRTLIGQGRLVATKAPWGRRFRWLVDRDSVEQLAKAGGVRKPKRLEDRLAALEQEVGALKCARAPDDRELAAERDDLRAKVVTLEEALARMRAASELQRQAADARADVVSHLLAATAANEKAERLYRRGLEELEEALAGATRAGHLGQG